MVENRAHGESFKDRLKRFQDGSPKESISTLLDSIHTFFNNEIKEALSNYQTYLMILGIHASILTTTEVLFNKRGSDGYKYFLEKFVDGTIPDTKFSDISSLLHDWRNILAHRWLGATGHMVGFDYGMNRGWEKRDETIFINPKIYCDHYMHAFSGGGEIYKFNEYLTTEELESAKERIINNLIQNKDRFDI